MQDFVSVWNLSFTELRVGNVRVSLVLIKRSIDGKTVETAEDRRQVKEVSASTRHLTQDWVLEASERENWLVQGSFRAVTNVAWSIWAF